MDIQEEIKVGDWVRMKSKPEVMIKVRFINPNQTIDFRDQRSEVPQHAHISDLEKITDENIITELEVNLSLQSPKDFLSFS